MAKIVQTKFGYIEQGLYTSDTFYTAEDRACMKKDWPAGEVEAAYDEYRKAVEAQDHGAAASFLSEDGRGGNTVFGLLKGPDAYGKYMDDNWSDHITNAVMWQQQSGGHIIERWCDTLPGKTAEGDSYDFFGFHEMVYAGEGKFRLLLSSPDVVGYKAVYMKWVEDGQADIHGHFMSEELASSG